MFVEADPRALLEGRVPNIFFFNKSSEELKQIAHSGSSSSNSSFKDSFNQMEIDYEMFISKSFDPKLSWVVYWFGFFIIICMLFFML